MKKILTILLAAVLSLHSSLPALAGVNQWSIVGSGPFATGLANQRINALALSGLTLYAGTGSATVFSYDITPPTATTSAATGITTTGATLNATVNANDADATGTIPGFQASVSFEYGTDTSYGSTLAATPATLSGSSGTAVSATLGSLTPGVTYHYRVKAVSSLSGTSYGLDASFSASRLDQSVDFTSSAPTNATVGGATYTPTASASSPLTVTIAVDASALTVCTISGGVVSFIAAGTCKLNASQGGSLNYNPATPKQQSFDVLNAQSITFSTSAPSNATVGGATYTPAATAIPSGFTVSITVDGTTSGVCSIAVGVVSFTAAGTCKLNANQSGGASYYPAPQVSQSFAVAALPAAPTIGTAAAGNARISVAFVPGALGSGDLVHYTAACSSSNGGVANSATGMTSPILVGSLTNGAHYTCQVNTASSAGTGPWSALSNVVTPTLPPGAPTNVSATPGHGSATLSLTPPAGTVTSYTATCTAAGYPTATATRTTAPVTVLGLIGGVSYACSVAASNDGGTGPSSASVSVTPLQSISIVPILMLLLN